jgi:hypothetical protein
MTAITEQTCTKAWLAAARHLNSQVNWRAYNIVLEIKDPLGLPADDRRVHDLVDNFLLEKADKRLSTIINTIFPAALYCRYGRAGVFEHFPRIWPTRKKHEDIKWGSYFRRMTSRTKAGTEFNPLEKLIAKLKVQALSKRPKHAAYEMGLLDIDEDIPLYDPAADSGRQMGGPCLSHVSFKLNDDNRLMLTAIYRSHHYVHRALGNLMGLAWLQHFVAKEVGVETAELVCLSSMATLDVKGWGKGDVTKLLDACDVAMLPQSLKHSSVTPEVVEAVDSK